MNKAVFWDRDGTINEMIIRDGNAESPRNCNEFKLVKGITKLMLVLESRGYLNIIVTNQPDIARGKLKPLELHLMHHYILDTLPVDDLLVCPHDNEDNCSCRKPKPGMILDAVNIYSIDLDKSFVVGDSWRDMDMAKRVGCRSVLISTWYNDGIIGSYVVSNINEIYDIIITEGGSV